MAEYLSPGVYIEEIPARLKAIEGVSTSTAGFVGECERGPTPGFVPFAPPAGFDLPRDATPVLCTSFAQYSRTFGDPPQDPVLNGYLGHSVRAFFDNGGKRVFIARVARAGAAASDSSAEAGTVALLARRPAARDTANPNNREIMLSTTAGLAQGDALEVVSRSTGNTIAAVNVVSVDTRARTAVIDGGLSVNTEINSVVLRAPRPIVVVTGVPAPNQIQVALPSDIDVGDEIDVVTVAAGTLVRRRVLSVADAGGTRSLTVDPLVPAPAAAADITLRQVNAGPQFIARNPGLWGDRLRVELRASERPPVDITMAVGAAATTLIRVRSSASFYEGACVELDHLGDATVKTVASVAEVGPGNAIRLDTPVADVDLAGSVRVLEFDAVITDALTGKTESFAGLSWNGNADPDIRRRHYSTILNARSNLVFVRPPWAGLGGDTEDPPTLDNRPGAGFAGVLSFANGADGAVSPDDDAIVGVDNGPGSRSGIHALADSDDIRIIAAPGRTGATVQNGLITQCESLRYRFAVLDSEPEPDEQSVVNDVLLHRNNYDSSFAAYYFPWVRIQSGDRTLYLPPSGYIAGVYARSDTQRGVHKAPANEVVRNITGLAAYVTTGEQDVLNPRGVNCIRRFEGRGLRVWGARTLSSDPEYRYINVRRWMIFASASIDRGTQWVVFEPNSPPTWARVVDSVSAFLHTQWRVGALFGRRPEDAFFARCDESTMTADDVQNGRLICEIGVAIVRPAEFVIFRIEQITGFGNA